MRGLAAKVVSYISSDVKGSGHPHSPSIRTVPGGNSGSIVDAEGSWPRVEWSSIEIRQYCRSGSLLMFEQRQLFWHRCAFIATVYTTGDVHLADGDVHRHLRSGVECHSNMFPKGKFEASANSKGFFIFSSSSTPDLEHSAGTEFAWSLSGIASLRPGGLAHTSGWTCSKGTALNGLLIYHKPPKLSFHGTCTMLQRGNSWRNTVFSCKLHRTLGSVVGASK